MLGKNKIETIHELKITYDGTGNSLFNVNIYLSFDLDNGKSGTLSANFTRNGFEDVPFWLEHNLRDFDFRHQVTGFIPQGCNEVTYDAYFTIEGYFNYITQSINDRSFRFATKLLNTKWDDIEWNED